MDFIARLPECEGLNVDAVSAYTQVMLRDIHRKMYGDDTPYIPTYITVPRWLVPQKFKHIPDPVTELNLNLYGHPLAGLYWATHPERTVHSHGYENVEGWECLYLNRDTKVFLGIYVDD